MDGTLPDGRTGKLWMCKKHDGHVLGLQVREKQNNHYIDLLLEFRVAINVSDCTENTIELPEMRISGTVEGTKHNIECTICGSTRTWWMGEAALERFLESRAKRAEVNHAS